jgi:hypothetical protein
VSTAVLNHKRRKGENRLSMRVRIAPFAQAQACAFKSQETQGKRPLEVEARKRDRNRMALPCLSLKLLKIVIMGDAGRLW